MITVAFAIGWAPVAGITVTLRMAMTRESGGVAAGEEFS
jgi:hypothetical protein